MPISMATTENKTRKDQGMIKVITVGENEKDCNCFGKYHGDSFKNV